MSIDYFDDLEDWVPHIEPEHDAAAVRAALLESLERVDAGDALPAERPGDDAPGHVLFGYGFDEGLTLHLYAIPEASLSDALRSAMATANYRAYAYDELMQGDDRAKAFMRLEAAFGVADWEDYLEDVEVELPGFGDEIPQSDRACLGPWKIGKLKHGADAEFVDGALERRFVASFMVRRCQ